MNIDKEIALLLGTRCFANPMSSPDCALHNFPQQIKDLVNRAVEEACAALRIENKELRKELENIKQGGLIGPIEGHEHD